MSRWGLLPVLVLSACAAAPVSPAHVPDAEGIGIAGSPLRIDFGRAEAGAVAAVARLEGRGPSGRADCARGVTAVRWPGGLTIHLRDGAFLGWSRPDGRAAGIGCGA